MSAQQTMMGLVYQGMVPFPCRNALFRPSSLQRMLSFGSPVPPSAPVTCISKMEPFPAQKKELSSAMSLSGSSPKSARMSTILQSATASQQTASPSAVIAGSAARAISITANRADGNLAAALMAVRQNLSAFRLRIWDFAKSPTAFRMKMPCFWATSFPADILVRSLPKSLPVIPLRSSV